MGYIEKNLVAGETVLLRPRYHPIRFLPGALSVGLGLLLAAAGISPSTAAVPPGALVAVGAGLVALGLAAIAWRAVVDSFDEFAITSLRIIKKTGFLTRRVAQIPLDKVQDLNLEATLWGRWLSYGSVEVQSASEDQPVVFSRIQNPEAFRNCIFGRRAAAPELGSVAPARQLRTPEARLEDLERLVRTGHLDEKEYRAKRQELIDQL